MTTKLERKLQTKTGRASLKVRARPYVGPLVAPNVHLTLRRGKRVDSWGTKTLKGTGTDAYTLDTFAKAERDGLTGSNVLDYLQAKAAAAKMGGADEGAKKVAPTAREAFDAYEAHLKAMGGILYNATYPRSLFPDHLLARPLPLLTAGELLAWRNSLLDDLAPGSVSRLCKAARAAFNLAGEHDERVRKNRNVWKTGLAMLADSSVARDAIISPAQVHAFYTEAYRRDHALGLLMHGMAITGARPSQVVRALVRDFADDLASPKIWMPRSAKGGSKERTKKREERYLAPVTLEFAKRLRVAIAGRKPTDRLFLRANGRPWHKNPSNDYREEIIEVAKAIGEDPARATAYCLRHSRIVEMLLKGASPEFVGKMCDTSATEISRHYAKYIVQHHEEFARTLLPADPPVPAPIDNVVPIGKAS